jgi:putative ABC transport system substrate-binding protein
MRIGLIAHALLLGLASIFSSGESVAQQAGKVLKVGILTITPAAPVLARLKENLANLGYVEAQNIVYEHRFAGAQLDRFPSLAAELVRLDVNLIVAYGGVASRAAQDATKSIPIIFTIVTDPVALGFAATMERPGGNATGITSLDPEQPRKQLELLKEAFPKITRFALLSDEELPGADASGLVPLERASASAARALGLQQQLVKIKGPTPDLEGAFATMAKGNAEALLVLEVPAPTAHRKRIAELAAAQRLPTIFPGGQADAGGLIAFGTSYFDTVPRIPALADKILKGAKPGDLPVEVTTRRELIFNLKTAKEIGVTISAELLKRADKVIE